MLVNFSNPAAVAHFREWRQRHVVAMRDADGRLGDITLAAATSETLNAAPARPLAAVFDIDEVLLCNIRAGADDDFQPEVTFGPLPAGWPPSSGAPEVAAKFREAAKAATAWPADRVWEHLTVDTTGLNPPMLGARALLMGCKRHGARVFLITGREEYLRGDTVVNLELAGMLGEHTGVHAADLIAGDSERMIMWPGTPAEAKGRMQQFKERARAEVAKKFRIVLNVGDQLSDLGRHGDEQLLISHSFYTTS